VRGLCQPNTPLRKVRKKHRAKTGPKSYSEKLTLRQEDKLERKFNAMWTETLTGKNKNQQAFNKKK
jgi:hypothetical protein